MNDRLKRAFLRQSTTGTSLGSPFMARLMGLFADRLQDTGPVAKRLLAWEGEVHAGAQSVPLRTAGALHGLVLDGTDAGLIAAYPPHEVSDDALWDAVEAAFAAHTDRIMAWLDQAPQTNEVRRSAMLLPAMWWVLGQYDLPIVLSELGASAGLNLSLDRYALEVRGRVFGPTDSPVRFTPEWTGPMPDAKPLNVAERGGVDINPLDITDEAERLRLLAYLWPDQPDRMRLTRAAIDLAETRPDRADAGDWLQDRLKTAHPGRLHIVYHSIAAQYFPEDTRAKCHSALKAAGAAATPSAPLAHIAMEADGDPGSAALTAQVWPSDNPSPKLLGRVDYHGRRIDWQENNC